MFVSLRWITLAPDRETERGSVITALQATAPQLPGVCSCWVAPVSPVAVINAGHVVWRMTFASERAALAATLDPLWRERIAPLLDAAQLSGVGYHITRSQVCVAGPGIWRALVFRVMPQALPTTVQALESGLLLLPKYIDAIRSWALSPVSLVEGPKMFTHVWEQEFDALDGLTGPYMTHPIHWGYADAFFDAESPQYIVDPQLTQVVGTIDSNIM